MPPPKWNVRLTNKKFFTTDDVTLEIDNNDLRRFFSKIHKCTTCSQLLKKEKTDRKKRVDLKLHVLGMDIPARLISTTAVTQHK